MGQSDFSEPMADEPTRERVRAAIGQVGGYWRPLAAVARLQEELGELAELLSPQTTIDAEMCVSEPADPLSSPTINAELCASELADLWIISTALADQFLGRVAEPNSIGHAASPTDEPFASLVVAAGRIARIVNYYDGPKTPRTLQGWISLGEAVEGFHRALAGVAHKHGVDLASAVREKLDAIPALDAGRFPDGEHDPSTAASLNRFIPTRPVNLGRCAGRARLWGSREWSSRSFASNVEDIVADLIPFTRSAIWERLDGYVVSGPAFTSTTLLESWLARLLCDLGARGRSEEDAAIGSSREDGEALPAAARGDECRLLFNGLPMLPVMFSPLYDASDPHHSSAGTFVLLQVGHSVEAGLAQ